MTTYLASNAGKINPDCTNIRACEGDIETIKRLFPNVDWVPVAPEAIRGFDRLYTQAGVRTFGRL